MKSGLNFKTLGLLLILALTVIFVIDVYTVNNKFDNVAKAANIKADLNFVASFSEIDNQFLITTSAINLDQIELAQLAQKKSLTPEIINLGKLMEISHSRFQRSVEALAQKKSIRIPIKSNETAMRNYNQLKALSSNDFDVSYCNFVISKQKEIITLLNKVEAENTDADSKDLAISEIPNLNAQLNRALLSQNNLKKN